MMWSLGILLITLVQLSQAATFSHHDIRANIVEAANIAATYDFVICGGGVAGLVLANRLTEDTNHSVLVIEAGGAGDDVASQIDIPSNAFFNSLLGSDTNWGYTTVAQPNAGGNQLSWPRGKVLGGSSAINGMYLVRPSQIEFDTWSEMVDNSTGNAPAWNWDQMSAAMKKTENFTAPSAAIQKAGDIQYDASQHGTSGPLHYSYPGYMIGTVGSWSPTLSTVGIPTNPDPSNGETWGSYVATSSINPTNWTRAYARSAYLDPLPPRSNLAVLTGQTVTRIIFSGNASQGQNLTATQVEYSSGSGAAKKTVNVGKEVLLTGGAVGSPQILMLSGVGPLDVLDGAKVGVELELPGVGHHLMDHLETAVIWDANVDTDATAYSNKYSSPAGTSSALASFVNSATAYVNITTLLGADAAASFQTNISNALAKSVSTILPSKDATVIAGYEAIYNTTLNKFLNSPIGQVELLLGLTGTSQAGDQSISIQAALQHPFSQGQIYITSNDPFESPAINPNYLSHFADTIMLREGLKLARKIGQTAPLSSAIGNEVLPGSNVNTDDEWDTWLAGEVGTEYHPSCTCAMLPLSQGGVVGADLKVYGINNVRVADSSVFPIEFAAHLQAPTYALAEQAATIIRSQYNGVPLPWAATATSTSQPAASSSSVHKSNAISVSIPHRSLGLVLATISLVALTLLLH